MSFLAPLFLLGTLAAGLPVILHLIRRSTRTRQEFSSLMFLMPTQPRLVKRSRLEHVLLLILRCAVLCLLALGFSRPFFKTPQASLPSQSGGHRIVLLLDTSASMQREALWTDAIQKAESILRKTESADTVAIYKFDAQPEAILSFEQWKSASSGERVSQALQRIRSLAPGWSGTHLGQALIAAAELLESTDVTSPAAIGQIIVISDLQSGSRLDVLSSYHWSKNVQVLFEPVQARNQGNASIQIAPMSSESAEYQTNPVVRVRVSNSPDSKKEQFQAGWAELDKSSYLGTPQTIYVPPGQSRVIAVSRKENKEGFGRILLRGDTGEFDNSVYWAAPVSRTNRIIHLANDLETDRTQPNYFLKRAFQDIPGLSIGVELCKPDADLSKIRKDTALIVDSDALSESQAALIRNQLLSGGTLLLAMKNTGMSQTLSALLGTTSISAEEVRPEQYVILGEIDFNHPLFQPFAGPKFGDFTRIHFWKYRRLTLPSNSGLRILARFDNGDPAILEASVGKGRLFVFTSAWHPEDSQLALSSKFVPLLYSLLDSSGNMPSIQNQYEVGQPVPIQSMSPNVQGDRTVKKPDGTEFKLPAGETRFSQTAQPGIYFITSTQPAIPFAVNLEALESRTAPLPLEDFERMGVPVRYPKEPGFKTVENQTSVLNTELENRQKLWHWLILATLALALAESWLAGRLSHRPLIQTKQSL